MNWRTLFVRLTLFLVLVIFSERCALLIAHVLKPPIRLLYLKGWVWESRELATICAGITGTDASWWERDPHCFEVVSRRIHALSVSAAVFLWSVLLLFLVLRLMGDELGPRCRTHRCEAPHSPLPPSPTTRGDERQRASPNAPASKEATEGGPLRH